MFNKGRFGVVWRSQCNGGQKCERRERPVNIASDMQKKFDFKKNSLSFALHI